MGFSLLAYASVSVRGSSLLFLLPLFGNFRSGTRGRESYSTHLGLPVWAACMVQHHDLKEDGLGLLQTASGASGSSLGVW